MSGNGKQQPANVADWPNTEPTMLEPLWAPIRIIPPWGLAVAALAGVVVGWLLGRQEAPEARRGRR